MLEKLALLKIAFCKAPVFSSASSRRTSVSTSIAVLPTDGAFDSVTSLRSGPTDDLCGIFLCFGLLLEVIAQLTMGNGASAMG